MLEDLIAQVRVWTEKLFYEVSLFADASSSGYGGYIEMHENNPVEENGICEVHVDRAVPELSCGPPDVGIIRSMEKDREIPLEVGVNMFPEVDVIPQEMGKESNSDKVKHTEKVDMFSAIDLSAKEYVEKGQCVSLMKGKVHTLDDSSKKPNSYTSPCESNRYWCNIW